MSNSDSAPRDDRYAEGAYSSPLYYEDSVVEQDPPDTVPWEDEERVPIKNRAAVVTAEKTRLSPEWSGIPAFGTKAPAPSINLAELVKEISEEEDGYTRAEHDLIKRLIKKWAKKGYFYFTDYSNRGDQSGHQFYVRRTPKLVALLNNLGMDFEPGETRGQYSSLAPRDSVGEFLTESGDPPWYDDPKANRLADKKTEIAAYVDEHSDPSDAYIPVHSVVKGVFGEDYARKEHALTERFLRDYSWTGRGSFFDFKKDNDKNTKYWVRAGKNLSSLELGKGNGTQEEEGLSWQSSLSGGMGSVEEFEEETKWAKERRREMMEERVMLTSDNYKKEVLADDLQTDVEARRGVRMIERNEYAESGVGPKYLGTTTATRFSNPKEADKKYASRCEMLETAASRHCRATVLTVTSAPSQYSVDDGYDWFDALEGAQKATDLLLQKFGRDGAWEKRPENLKVLEFTDSALPHFHVVLFGVLPSQLPDEDEIVDYLWNTREHCKEIDIREAKTNRDNIWVFQNGTCSLRWYLYKALRGLKRVAHGEDPSSDTIGEGEFDLWKVALYWLSEKQFVYGSNSLKNNSSAASREMYPRPRYENVGVISDLSELPGYIDADEVVMEEEWDPPELDLSAWVPEG